MVMPTNEGTQATTEELRRALASEEGGRRWLRRLALAAGFALVIGAGMVWRVKHRPLPPAKYMTAVSATGDVIEKVQATGSVNPLLQVNVGAQVSGRVSTVYVDFNSIVKKGDVLAEIDPTILGTQVSQQQANVASQRAQLMSVRAQAETARITFERAQRLFAQNLTSRAELDTAKGQYDVAKAGVDAQAAGIGASQAQLQASVTNVGYAKIYSPVDGMVVSRTIDPGQTVVASFSAPNLFIIAQDLRKMRVLADIDEADVGKLREKLEVDAVVDAFPGEAFHGIVKQLRFNPNNNQGVVTYSAIVEVDNPEEKLRPGMTATVTITTRESKNVVRIPNAALRYKPSPPKGKDDKPIPQPPDPPLAKGTGRVWLLVNDKPGEERTEQKIVTIGATDGVVTEVTGGSLEVGAKVVTDELDADKKKGSF
jgi:HlyD family secretion protein